MITLKNITLSELYQLEPETLELYLYAIEYSKPFLIAIDHLGIGDILDLPFGTVKEIQQVYESDGFEFNDWIVKLCEILKVESLGNKKLIHVCNSIKYLIKGIEQIITLERENLGHTPDANEEEADLSDLAKMGVFLQIDSLAKGDITKHERIKSLPYSKCFAKLLADKYNAEYSKRYQNILTKKRN